MSNDLSVFDFAIFYDIHRRIHSDAIADDCTSVRFLAMIHFPVPF